MHPELQPSHEMPSMIISVALTGAIPEKSKYPNLPTEPEEIARSALDCVDAGASIVHLHMRDSEGRQTQDAERLSRTIEILRRERPELIICATTTSRGANSFDDRLTPLGLPRELLPDLASLTLGSYNTPFGVNVNPESEIRLLLEEMGRVGVSPELEIFEPGMLYTYFRLRDQQVISHVPMINLLLGVHGASPALPRELVHLVDLVPPGVEWAVAGIGRHQKRMTLLGALFGGNVRVGMEDDPRGEGGSWSNTDAVKRAVRAAEIANRDVASASEARARMGLTKV